MMTTSRTSLSFLTLLTVLSVASPLRYPVTTVTTTSVDSVGATVTANAALYRRTTTQRKYYATWNPTKLCSTKSTFDAWENSYASLEECCEEVFGWDYEDCIKSE
mmetsp:Transcript_24735/g.44427  ORF Transcript_24735/g.44427 Transcript_24735/m.44427 type:complete len:105 (+) Transcript_24735:42-356(+)|eukprot:CAMPEP_0201894600 /NCGR_PEP_ID=MMETSP0902-20130614/41028_1 /ASSEMBLY_ACC=CAM_ASM_000551 /TAXON_ID=420261 /ORGANISM="Thalassiosira antarctica, Strain CCMP982" /LENGTH=104 /DNA_ID=CAMNT_0048426685 /DNA_START=94 /DNA_END=408 /DNA_ORIENTATION=-